ncbi:MAG: hypothetical protein IT424_06290 [Pirellulales bacterium]|nr:hypothetical protein [Pirellulales bacterium]
MSPVRSFAAGLALTAALACHCRSRADSTAYFWLSNEVGGPAVPVIYALPGSLGEIGVWARPAMGYRLSAVSLDLKAEQSGVVSFTDVLVHNPLLQAMPETHRHQITFDSDSGLAVEADLIDSFLGLTFFEDAAGLPNGAGMGLSCGTDLQCCDTFGEPSWRFATVGYEAGMSYGATDLYLQIGEQGVWQSPAGAAEPDPPWNTSAVFGLTNDLANQWTVPQAGGVDDRHAHQGAADATIQVASADFDEDGDVDGADFLTWQRGLDAAATHAGGDADGNGGVDGVDLAAWKFQFGASGAGAPAQIAVPEPSDLVAIVALLAVRRTCRRLRGKDRKRTSRARGETSSLNVPLSQGHCERKPRT